MGSYKARETFAVSPERLIDHKVRANHVKMTGNLLAYDISLLCTMYFAVFIDLAFFLRLYIDFNEVNGRS